MFNLVSVLVYLTDEYKVLGGSEVRGERDRDSRCRTRVDTYRGLIFAVWAARSHEKMVFGVMFVF